MSQQKYTVTCALPYANGPLHLGHVAGVYLPADIFVRFLRHKKQDVAFICGSDEYGAAITIRAKKEGITPREIVDKYHGMLAKSFKDFGISFDIFHRTTAPTHTKMAQDFFLKLNENGAFTQETSEQYYDEEFHQFLADRYIMGECPKCGNPSAYGDQCEKCGSALSPTDLINPISTLSGKKPVLKETTHWYLPMERHENWLREYIKEGKFKGEIQHDVKKWRNQVIGQCLSWIDGGLHSRAMTRDLDWGIPVPLKEGEGKVLYVWLDAPIGYISATKDWADSQGKDWRDYWTGDRKLIHFIGKDNIVFHAVIFPILLKEHGEFILPNNVPASEFLNLEGNKFSTSRNWAVWLHEYLDRYPDKVDELKYVLTSIAPENKDSEFTWADYQARVNNELADIFGNFVNRALVLNQKYFEGKVPTPHALTEEDKKVIEAIQASPKKIEELLYNYKMREAQAEVMNLARIGNRYLAETEPWKLAKTDMNRVETILHIALQLTANLAILFDLFLPNTAAKLRGFLNISECNWEEAGSSNILQIGDILQTPSILFQKIEDDFVEKERAILASTQQDTVGLTQPTEHIPQKEHIQFDEFLKMDIRVGQIVEAKPVQGADKLLELLIDVGIDKRTIVSGIAEQFKPEDIIGKKITVLLNLPPRKLRGVISNGMVLMAENAQGKLSFLLPDQSLEVGSIVR
ncbi:MAG: methionine--tRNA ligase [Brumimicrobium sp.]|nr:methionine--tRNA ligase [Brumimicrobium sp.]